ncbi:MAG: SAM-dependent methyltransferase, partial [Planktothrix sp.]
SPCMNGWPSQNLFDYNYQIISLSDPEFEFLKACDQNLESPRTVEEILTQVSFDLAGVRSLINRQLILLSPSQN